MQHLNLTLAITAPAASPATWAAAPATAASSQPAGAAAWQQWRELSVPHHAAWAQNVLVAVIWIFVIAALLGPIVVRFSRKPAENRRPPSAGW